MGPFVVIANHGHTLDIDINRIPECIASDRVRPAPGRIEPKDYDVSGTESVRDEIVKALGHTNSSSRLPVPRMLSTSETGKDYPMENVAAPKTLEEFVIEKLEKLREAKCGKKYVFANWHKFPKEEKYLGVYRRWQSADSIARETFEI